MLVRATILPRSSCWSGKRRAALSRRGPTRHRGSHDFGLSFVVAVGLADPGCQTRQRCVPATRAAAASA